MRQPSIVADAERRLIVQAGMPFPIVERPVLDVPATFDRGPSFEKAVPLSLLIATQRDFNPDVVLGLMDADDADPIDVVLSLGKYYIADGHHRAIAAKYRGESVVDAHVVEA